MRSIRIDNPRLDSYLTDIATDYTSGTSLVARSNNSFASNDLLVVGNPGEELTEQKKVDSLSGNTTFTLASTLKFQHNKGTPLYKSIWDFVSIEGKATSLDSFAELTESPIQWDNQERKTIYFHQDGTDAWSYRFRFKNSVTSTYSEYSPTLLGTGFTKFQMGYLIRGARQIAGDKEGKIMTTDELLRSATRAKNIIRAHNARYWFWKVDGFQSGVSISATSNNAIYSLASISELGAVNYIEYKYTEGSTSIKYLLTQKGDAEFLQRTRDLNRPANNFPREFRLLPPDANSSKGYIQLDYPTKDNSVGTLYISHYKEETDYTTVEDSTSIIMPEILQDYLIAEIYATKGNEAKAKQYYAYFTGPENREKTLALEKLSGIALLDELDRQYKTSQGQPKSLVRFRGQKAMGDMFGNRSVNSPDYNRINYFDSSER